MAEDVSLGSAGTDSAHSAGTLIEQGVAALEGGRHGDAEASFRKALALEPDNPNALRRLGVAVYLRGEFEEARSLLDLAIGLAPDDADAYNNLAAILMDQGEITEAEVHFRRALELSPSDSDINFNLGLILLQRGNFVEARQCFAAVVAERPDDADAHHNLGMAWRQETGREAAATAIAAFRRAVEIDGDDCDSLLELSVLLREEGDLVGALEASDRVLQTENDTGRAHHNHGAILYERGRYEDAARSFQRALAAEPPALAAHDALGRTHAAMGDTNAAVRAFRRGLEAAPDDHRIKRHMRDAYSRFVPSWYLPAVNDKGRNEAYRSAIETAVGPGDVVLDIGTGSGLLAMTAARAGARQVVGCEMLGSMAEMAQRVVKRNGFEDVVTVVPRQSNELSVGESLTEPASVVIAQNLDVTLIGEGAIQALRHATRHLARPDAKVIPRAARIWGTVVEWPGERAINPVKQIGGFDLSDFDLFRNPNMHVPFDEERDAHRELTGPFEIAAYDFTDLLDYSDSDVIEVLTLPAVESGTAHAVTVWFELDLDSETSFSTRHETNLNHWHRTAQFLDRDLSVTKGETFHLTVRRTDTRLCFEAGLPDAG